MKLPIMYFKADPTDYCRISAGGKVIGEGKGISRLIIPFRTTIETVSTSLMNQPYSFPEVTSDNQQVTIQGSFLYKASEPKKVLDNFNCSVDPKDLDSLGNFEQISEQIANNIRSVAKQFIQSTTLENMLRQSEGLAKKISADVTTSKVLTDLGLSVQTIYVNQITPEPAIAKALGAVYREGLLTIENKATYERRAEAVRQEKQIRENEQQNQIALEKQRAQLIDLQEANAKKEGAYKAEVQRMELAVYERMDPEKLKAHALMALGQNAKNVTTLAFSPGLLTTSHE